MASTEPFDVSAVLAALGVKPEVAKSLQNKMDGVDYLNLVNSLSDDSESGRQRATQILAKYGIKIHKVPHMENTRLESIFKEMHAGKDYDAAHNTAFVRPISEMESPSAAMSGYSSFVRAANDSDAETLRDWLEENEFDYQNNDKHTFLVQSADRERTYRLNNFMSKMHGKTSMFDDISEEEETVAEKKTPKGVAIPASSPRNPIAAGMVKKSGGGAHNSKDPSRRDAWSRSAKHKGRSYESIEESIFTQGESVQFEGSDCSVQIPSGPNGTVGLLIDGKVRMVRESDITRVDEGVLGMTKVDPLYRLRELAGVKPSGTAKIEEDDFGTVDPMADMDVADDFDDAGADFDAGDISDDFADPADDMGMDLGGATDDLAGSADIGGGLDPMADDGMDGDFGGAGPALGGGVPGELPPMGAGDALGVGPVDSEAYTQIQDHLNNIQASLGDVKLSEYRSLIAKLEALAVQVKSMGRDYLGEQRKMKK